MRGMVWTAGGIGANVHGGASLAGLGAPLLAMDGIGWYHYWQNLVAGAGFRLSSASIGADATLFSAVYELHSSMVWPLGGTSAIQVDLPARFGRTDLYVDTLDGGDPFLNTRQFVGSGILVSAGTRRGTLGASISGGWNWTWWPGIDSARNTEVLWEFEPAISMGLRNLWPRSDSLSKAFDVVVKIPVQYAARRLEPVRVDGRSFAADPLQVGIRIGFSVVL